MRHSHPSPRVQPVVDSTVEASISTDTCTPATGRRTTRRASNALPSSPRLTRSSTRHLRELHSSTRVDRQLDHSVVGGVSQDHSNGQIATHRSRDLSMEPLSTTVIIKDLFTEFSADSTAGASISHPEVDSPSGAGLHTPSTPASLPISEEVIPSSLPPSQDLTVSASSTTLGSVNLIPSSLPPQYSSSSSSPSPSSFSSFVVSLSNPLPLLPRLPLPPHSLPPPSSLPLSPFVPPPIPPPSSSSSPSATLVGPQRELEFSLIAPSIAGIQSVQGVGDGVDPLSPITGTTCGGHAADRVVVGDEGRNGGTEKNNNGTNRDINMVRGTPMAAWITCDPLWVVDGVQVLVWTLRTLGGGRCIFASTAQALFPSMQFRSTD